MKLGGVGMAEMSIILALVFVFTVLVLLGYIAAYIALTHSIKKRIVWGTDFSAASVFAWALGWFVLASLWGLPTLIYFLVKRGEINATKAQCAQVLARSLATREHIG
jgi:hypothetical protein